MVLLTDNTSLITPHLPDRTTGELKAKEAQLFDKHREWQLQEAKLQQAKEYLQNRAAAMQQAMSSLVSQLEKMEARCMELAVELDAEKQAAVHIVCVCVCRVLCD